MIPPAKQYPGRTLKKLSLGLLLLSMMFTSLALVLPAHATGPVVNGAAGAWNGGNTPISMTVGNTLAFAKGDVVVVYAMAEWSNSSGNAASPTPVSVSSVFDSTLASDITFTLVGIQSSCIATATNGCSDYLMSSAYSGVFVGTSGSDTIDVTFASAHGVNLQLNMLMADTTGVTSVVVASGGNSCLAWTKCPTASLATFTNSASTIVLGGLIVEQQACGISSQNLAAAAGYSLACTLQSAGTGAMEYMAGTASPSPTTASFTQIGPGNTAFPWLGYAVMLSSNNGSNGGTTNIQCNPACTSTNGGTYAANSTSMFSGGGATKTMFWFIQQNVNNILTIQNVTVKVAQVSINAATAKLGYALYEPASPLVAASAGNQWTLQYQGSWPITNGTTAFFLHANPGWNVCANCYYMVAILANSTHSNSASILGSGVKFYETSAPVTEYKFSPAGTVFPLTFYSNSLQTPRFFLYSEGIFTVVTTTSTSTTTLTGTSFVSSTLTVTSTTLDSALAINTTTDYAIALILIVGPGLLLGGGTLLATKGGAGFGGFAIMFVVGMAIGTGLGVQAGIVTGGFEALAAIAMIFMSVMAFVGMRGGGGG